MQKVTLQVHTHTVMQHEHLKRAAAAAESERTLQGRAGRRQQRQAPSNSSRGWQAAADMPLRAACRSLLLGWWHLGGGLCFKRCLWHGVAAGQRAPTRLSCYFCSLFADASSCAWWLRHCKTEVCGVGDCWGSWVTFQSHMQCRKAQKCISDGESHYFEKLMATCHWHVAWGIPLPE